MFFGAQVVSHFAFLFSSGNDRNFVIVFQLHKAADFLEMNVEKTTTLQCLRNKILSLDDMLLKFLFLAGFQQQVRLFSAEPLQVVAKSAC